MPQIVKANISQPGFSAELAPIALQRVAMRLRAAAAEHKVVGGSQARDSARDIALLQPSTQQRDRLGREGEPVLASLLRQLGWFDPNWTRLVQVELVPLHPENFAASAAGQNREHCNIGRIRSPLAMAL